MDRSAARGHAARMFTSVDGLPVHVLLIHLVVVLVPASALLLVAQAWSPVVRRWAGVLGPLSALAALVLVPITASSGQWLKDQLRPTPLIERHADLGERLWPWVLAVFVLSVAVYLLGRRGDAAGAALPPTAGAVGVQVLVAVLATAVAVGAMWQTYRVGDSGARAVWTGTVPGLS